MGKVILLNTPIGNLGDVTVRALEAYRQGTIFFAEDTRNFKQLLNHLQVSLEGKRVYSYHDHSQEESLNFVLELTESQDIYLVSDAGSPIVSDPAYPVVKAAYERGIPVDTISGVSSVISALELAGLPANPFTFIGFLPRDKSKQDKVLERYKNISGSYVLFESPHRVLKTVEKLFSLFERVEVALVREISKQFQEVIHICCLEELKNKAVTQKGEFVIVFHHQAEEKSRGGELPEELKEYLAGRQSKKDLAKLLSRLSGGKTKEIYSFLK